MRSYQAYLQWLARQRLPVIAGGLWGLAFWQLYDLLGVYVGVVG